MLVRRGIDGPAVEPGPQIRSLAVLPFDNLMQDPEQDYFVEGMHEALITDLSKIGALRVISRTSAMRYAGTDKSLPEIARELDVDALIEGSVLRADGQVRITAQLIDGETGAHLWAESYDRELEDVLALLSEVAREIAEEIEVVLTPEQRARLAPTQRLDPAAFESFLRGVYAFNQFHSQGYRDAVTLYNEADFRGRDETFHGPVRDLGGTRIGSDSATSIRVAPGCRAVLYRDRDFRGPSTVVTGDVSSLKFTPVGNDSVSSIEVDCGR